MKKTLRKNARSATSAKARQSFVLLKQSEEKHSFSSARFWISQSIKLISCLVTLADFGLQLYQG